MNRTIVLALALTLTGACAPTAPASPAPTPPAPASPAAARPASVRATPWATAPVTVTHQPSVPPVPILQRVRSAAHADGFDRVVLDLSGALPGYTATYVPEVREDGSDRPIPLPGQAFLLIVLHPAQAHRADGSPTVTGIHRIDLPAVTAYAIAGDYEGHVSIALALTGVHRYHIGELPGRLSIDVAV